MEKAARKSAPRKPGIPTNNVRKKKETVPTDPDNPVSAATAEQTAAQLKINEEISKKLKVGSRVVRGMDWIWGNQDGDPPGMGTIVEGLNSRYQGWTRVEWDNGNMSRYRMGQDGKFDLKPLEEDVPAKENPKT